MPGMTGIIGGNISAGDSQLFWSMLEAINYEDIYLAESFFDEKAPLAIGWTRFRNIRMPAMPFWAKDGMTGLIITGVIPGENHDEAGLFSERSLEKFLEAYIRKGPEGLFDFNGQYSGILLDRRNNSTIIFSDRFGLERVYFRIYQGKLFFSTEAKALLAAFPETRNLDERALAELLTCGCTLNNNCLYKGISILPPFSFWKINSYENLENSRYKSFSFQERSLIASSEEYYVQLKRTLQEILPRYTEIKFPVGISLTGGKDTRILLSYSRLDRANLKGYTFGSIYRASRDEKIGRIIAREAGLPFTVIRVCGEFFDKFPQLAEQTVFVSDGLMDVTGAAGLYTCRLAREISPVRLTGNYGQEVLENYIAFKPGFDCLNFVNQDYRPLVEEAANKYYEEKANTTKLQFILSRQMPWYHYSRYKLESSQLLMLSPYIDRDFLGVVLDTSPEAKKSAGDLRLRLICEGNSRLARIETDLGFRCSGNSLFRKMKKTLQVFTFKAEYAFNHGMPPWLARIDHFLKPFHPERLFLGRHKFYHFRVWYRDRFAGYLQEILLDRKSSGRNHVDPRKAERMLRQHIKGTENHTQAISLMLSVELIYRKLLGK